LEKQTLAGISHHTINVDGVRINYVEAGVSRHGRAPVLLLHGGGPGASGLSNYSRNILPLAARLGRVIVPDMPGFGASEYIVPDGPGTGLMGAYADVTLAFMDALGIAEADMVGNSMGGGQCLSIALRRPERIRRMVLMGPGGLLAMHTPFPTEGNMRMATFYAGEGPTAEKMRAVLELLVFDQSVITEELVAERLEAASRPDVMQDPPWRRGLDPFWQERLWEIQHETLIVWGREDRVNPVDGAFYFNKVIPNSELHLFPSCGHWVQWEKPGPFNAMVAEFFDR
jgi:Predicted hydrolases or acyltransferases (alpha/beta hydrolase superfamily)